LRACARQDCRSDPTSGPSVTLRYSQRHRGDPRFCSARNMRNAGVIGAPIIWLPCYVGLRSWISAAVDRRDHWVAQLPAGLGCSYRAIWLWVAAPFPLIVTNQDRIIALASDLRPAAIYPFRYFAANGGLASYRFDPVAPHQEAASHVDRILKGEKPGNR
jgi:hypothetical protein